MNGARPPRRRAARAAALVLVLAAGAAVRLAPARQVFRPDGVRFTSDYDPHYHALRAERTVASYPRVPWRDPWLGYPTGADVLWPPLFDEVIATSAMLAAGGTPGPQDVARAAAMVPVVFGVATLPLVAALGAALGGPWTGLVAAAFLALLPAASDFSLVGRADHHAAELFFACWVFLAFLRAWRPRRAGGGRRALALLAAGIVLSFWNWMGSSFYLLLLALFVGARHLAAPAGDRLAPRAAGVLAAGGSAAAAALAGSIALLGPPGSLRSVALAGVTGLQVSLTAMAAAFGLLLWLAARRDGLARSRPRRLAELAGAGAAPLALALLALPRLRDEMLRGLLVPGAGNALNADITELYPLFLNGFDPLALEVQRALGAYGFLLFALPVAAWACWRAARARPELRHELGFLAVWGGAALALTLARQRFGLYLSAPLALCWALALDEAVRALASRLPGVRPAIRAGLVAAAWLALLAPALPALDPRIPRTPPGQGPFIALLRWLGSVPAQPGREAVMSPWGLGHAIQYFARKPVVANNFGTDGGPRSVEDTAELYFATDGARAEAVMARRRAGFLVLPNPGDELYHAHGFAPPGSPVAVSIRRDWREGQLVELTPAFWDLVVSRLYFVDGASTRGAATPAAEGFRLLYETPSSRPPHPVNEGRTKLFGRVAGAALEVRGLRPEAALAATAQVWTNQGRTFHWSTQAAAGADGVARLRLPYATGANGAVVALPWSLSDGAARRQLEVTEEQVAEGRTVTVEWGKR